MQLQGSEEIHNLLSHDIQVIFLFLDSSPSYTTKNCWHFILFHTVIGQAIIT